MKSLKTPLRYPGGKSRALTKLSPFIPDLSAYDEYREPFLGGGSVALFITKRYPHIKVWVNDLYEPLVNFWKHLQMYGPDMRMDLIQLKNRHCEPVSAKNLFLESKDYLLNGDDDYWKAISFYVVNKCSFSGLTESSSFSKMASENNFTMRGIERLPFYSDIIKKWVISNYSYDYLFEGNNNIDGWKNFIYLDPPYAIKDNLYGRKGSMHKSFDHDRFAQDCSRLHIDALVSYNSDQMIKDRFEGWTASEYDLTYTLRSTGDYMKEQHKRKELLLFNYGTEGLAEFN
tara:strand:- start:679 stop:1539 length:861 start_codon:yes stop_codon:yes gene_type:complete